MLSINISLSNFLTSATINILPCKIFHYTALSLQSNASCTSGGSHELLADVLTKTDQQPSSDSLLSIVTNQRERFKERNTQLEEVHFLTLPW